MGNKTFLFVSFLKLYCLVCIFHVAFLELLAKCLLEFHHMMAVVDLKELTGHPCTIGIDKNTSSG